MTTSPSLTSLPLVLAGYYTVGDLWPSTNLVLPAWLLLIIIPRWNYTQSLTLVPPIIHSTLYASIIIPLVINGGGGAGAGAGGDGHEHEPAMDFTTLEGVVKMFQDPSVVFVGWVHYLVFDLLVGRAISIDALERGSTNLFYYCVVVPCLVLTFMLGPTGFLVYSIIRTAFLPKLQGFKSTTDSVMMDYHHEANSSKAKLY